MLIEMSCFYRYIYILGMDKLIKASLIASIVTIGGNSEEEDKEKDKEKDKIEIVTQQVKEKIAEVIESSPKNISYDQNVELIFTKTDEASLLKTIVTCNNCFKGFDDKETPNK